jgi:uncharacterized protein GlcG (DUF336 family)
VTLHLPLLHVAQAVISEATQDLKLDNKQVVASVFDPQGVAVLMERLLELSNSLDGFSEEVELAMKKSFQTALAQAMVAENAKKQQMRSLKRWDRDYAFETFRYADFSKQDVAVQERFVETKMLDF